MNSLKKGNELKARSIAIPAISSGIFGFPKPLCAEVLFDCIEKYAHERSDKETIFDISFTNIDLPTVDAFAHEFDKRKFDI